MKSSIEYLNNIKEISGLKQADIDKIISIISRNESVDEIIIFGSRAKGSFRKGSDVDLALKGNELKIDDVFAMQNAFEDSSLPYMFDLLIYHKIKETALREHIDRVGINIYCK